MQTETNIYTLRYVFQRWLNTYKTSCAFSKWNKRCKEPLNLRYAYILSADNVEDVVIDKQQVATNLAKNLVEKAMNRYLDRVVYNETIRKNNVYEHRVLTINRFLLISYPQVVYTVRVTAVPAIYCRKY